MTEISLDSFKESIAPLQSLELRTLKQLKAFKMRVEDEGLFITPGSTGTERQMAWSTVEAFLHRFNQQRSLSPSHYPGSFNKSYLLALLKAGNLV